MFGVTQFKNTTTTRARNGKENWWNYLWNKNLKKSK
jgi:hypothetical protein